MAVPQFRAKEVPMVLCPVAIAVGCQKCPVFKMCPLKGVIGDQAKDSAGQAARDRTATAAGPRQKK